MRGDYERRWLRAIRNNNLAIIGLLGFSAVTASQSASAAERRAIAVLPLQSSTVPEIKLKILNNILVNEVANTVDARVVSPADIAAVLGFEETKEAMGCDDLSCAAEVAGALGVEELLVARADVLGDQLILTGTWMDARSADALARRTVTIQNDENLYQDGVHRLVERVFGPSSRSPSESPAVGTSAQPPASDLEVGSASEENSESETESQPEGDPVTDDDSDTDSDEEKESDQDSDDDLLRIGLGGAYVWDEDIGARADLLLRVYGPLRLGVNGVWYSDLGQELNSNLFLGNYFAGFSYRRNSIDGVDDDDDDDDDDNGLSQNEYSANLGVGYWAGPLYGELKYQFGTDQLIISLTYQLRI
ncbi:MAG: hypothetical protein AAGJ56_08140 [Myxococcota bacterium]